MAALDRELDDRWRADRDYIIADMNGSAVFLLAALKMRLGLAARRYGVGAEAVPRRRVPVFGRQLPGGEVPKPHRRELRLSA